LLGCGVVTGIGAVNRAGVRIGSSVCVIGCGGVGLQVIAGARLAGAATIIAVDRDAGKLEHARRRGATHTVNATEEDVVTAARAASEGGVEYAFEVVGRPETIRQAWQLLRAGGSATVVGLAPRGVEVSLPAIEFLSEKSITGSYYGSRDVRTALTELAAMVLDGRLEIADVISDVIRLDGVQDALERLRRAEGGRSVVVLDDELAGVSP
jgi:S-(hydroxymethyl)glutathione dehydrogenase/alcohol dehydrogenase